MAKNLDYYTWDRKEMAIFLPEAYNSVLEIGCGEGAFTTYLKPGCEIWGIEPNKIAAEAASQRMYRVLSAKYYEVLSVLPDDHFELVICNDVIEHMEDHDAFFDSIKKKMKRNACIVGSIPNVRHYSILKDLLLRRDWRYTDAGILDRTHLRFFTEISFKRTLEQHSFSIERYEGINRLTFNSFSIKSILHRLVINFLRAVTLGSYNDICFLQFGFRARKSNPSNQSLQRNA